MNNLIPPISTYQFSGHQFWVLHLDKIHPLISGNKFYKLKYNLIEAKKHHQKILTFGGAYSNHIHATAFAAMEQGVKSMGIIRGEELEKLNPTLKDAQEWGMQLHFVSREDYRKKSSSDFIEGLKKKFGDFYLIPEGGSNELALRGCEEIYQHIPHFIKNIIVAAGTGTTAAGIINSTEKKQKTFVIGVLKGDFLQKEIAEKLNKDASNWELLTDYHFGGYAKWKPGLIDFMNKLYTERAIKTDSVYTAKVFYAANDLFEKSVLKSEETLIIHSGGLQGNRGFVERNGRLIDFS